jgi:ketosteroid isomerase-like protein
MRKEMMSRRMLLEAGACGLTAAVLLPRSAQAATGLSPQNEQTVRGYYTAWESKKWPPLDSVLTDDFTFTSPNNDDHISKSVYKTRCWDSNVNLIQHFELTRVIGSGNDAFVMYVCHITGGKTIQNVEYLQVRDGKIASVRCYFGGQNSYPAGVLNQQ